MQRQRCSLYLSAQPLGKIHVVLNYNFEFGFTR